MAEKSYGFAIGNLRARENTLLKASDMAQLAAVKTVDALTVALADKGIGERSGTGDVSQALAKSHEQLWCYLNEIAPDAAIFAPFIADNDFHNLKVVLKGIIKAVDYSRILLHPDNIPVESLQNAVREKRFDLLPDYMGDAALRAYEILTSTGDSQLSDGVLDAACMRAKLSFVNAKEFKSEFTAELIRKMVFFDNIKSAIRAAKAGKNAAFLDETLVDTGYIPAARVRQAALGGVDELLDVLPLAGKIGEGAAAAYRISPSEFERYCDNCVMAAARGAKRITMGVEPVVGYMMARLYEMKNIRIIYSGVKTGQPQEKTLGKLRELYG